MTAFEFRIIWKANFFYNFMKIILWKEALH